VTTRRGQLLQQRRIDHRGALDDALQGLDELRDVALATHREFLFDLSPPAVVPRRLHKVR